MNLVAPCIIDVNEPLEVGIILFKIIKKIAITHIGNTKDKMRFISRSAKLASFKEIIKSAGINKKYVSLSARGQKSFEGKDIFLKKYPRSIKKKIGITLKFSNSISYFS